MMHTSNMLSISMYAEICVCRCTCEQTCLQWPNNNLGCSPETLLMVSKTGSLAGLELRVRLDRMAREL